MNEFQIGTEESCVDFKSSVMHYREIMKTIVEQKNHWTQFNESRNHAVDPEKELVKGYLDKLTPTLQKRLEQEIYGLGPLEELIQDQEVDEILINGLSKICFERSGLLKIYDDSFYDQSSFARIFETISDGFFKSISYENPTANGFWNNFRIHVIAPPLTKYKQISMRRIGGQKFKSLSELSNKKFVNKNGLELLLEALDKKLNLLICGATSSGKTTFIQCLMNECPDDRFVILEDSEELIPPNVLSSALICPTRQEQYSTVFSMKDLVKESLRMRPDRIVLGEARSDEAKDYIQALSTGHRGCFSSIHAASPRDALIRLECLIAQGAQNWTIETIQRLIFSSIDLVIHIEKSSGGMRELKSISKITSLEKNGFLLHEIYEPMACESVKA